MPRGSFKHEDAMMGFGFQEGYVEVIKACVAVHQFPPSSKTGIQSDPFCAARFTLKKLNEDYSEPDEADTVVVPIRLHSLDSIRPGHVNDPDDEEAEDLGREVDTEGNTAYFEEGAMVGGSWGAFEESLRRHGFRAEISGRGYFPDYVGMKCHLRTVEAGTYVDKKTKEEKKSTNLVCDQIHTFPYDKKGKSESKGKAKDAAGGKEKAKEALMGVLADLTPLFKKAVKPDKAVKRSAFQVQLQLELTRQKVDGSLKKPILDLVKDDDQLQTLSEEMGTFVIDLDENTITFPSE